MPPLEPEASRAETEHLAIQIMTRILMDRENGHLRTLSDYMALFPGRDELVAEEYLRIRNRLTDGDVTHAPASGRAPSETVGPYRLERKLGRGGQGTVWLSFDTRLERPVALKVVPISPLVGDVAPRFQREARAASRLSHPGICGVYDVGSDDAIAWIAMQYVPGETWEAEIDKRADRLPDSADVRTIVALIERVARALHAAHESGITHRDVKPSNVIVTPDGDPVLVDFGVARVAEGNASLTLTGEALGTPAYMSPEQLTGERVDGRADVWSLGATAYELLCGRRPFAAPTRERLVHDILRNEPERPSRLNRAISRDLDVVLQTALAKEADRRYGSALALAEDLELARTGRPIRARKISAGEWVARWARRNPVVAASLTALFVVLSGALAITMNLLREKEITLQANETLLDEVTQLADVKIAGDLLAEESELWPANPSRAEEMRRWLIRARDLEERIEMHRASLASLNDRLSPDVSARLAAMARIASTETNAWMEEQLSEIIRGIEELVIKIPIVEARHALASTLYDTTVQSQRDAWAAVAARIAADPRFVDRDGRPIEVLPQLGLVPLGPDPTSGLEEFGHPQTGTVPVRDPESGTLAITEHSSVVLVLLPGGDATVGCYPADAYRFAGEPYVDAWSREYDGPPRHVWLDPFLIAKHEFTVRQWERHVGMNPALYARGGWAHPTGQGLQPVEQVSLLICARVFSELDLTLPTEAQWEYAIRAGTTTPWYTGEDPKSLAGHVNLADLHAASHGGPRGWDYQDWLTDNTTGTAPIGSYAPNPFGLHDMAGNVCEWTRTSWADLSDAPPLDGDGGTDSSFYARVVRGSSFAKGPDFARSAHREPLPAHLSPPDVGVRAARALLWTPALNPAAGGR